MQSDSGVGDCINSYALVSYIPGPLGLYLDRIRRELVRTCVAQSHVTILPPRSLSAFEESTKVELSQVLQDYRPFRVDLEAVQVFESTSVIYLDISSGSEELKQLHQQLNEGSLACSECYGYHPHVTLAQNFAPQELNDLMELARARWREFQNERSFEVERLTFVQNTTSNRWLDLADFPLGNPVLSGT
jgi:2'-5' RNA ligase